MGNGDRCCPQSARVLGEQVLSLALRPDRGKEVVLWMLKNARETKASDSAERGIGPMCVCCERWQGHFESERTLTCTQGGRQRHSSERRNGGNKPLRSNMKSKLGSDSRSVGHSPMLTQVHDKRRSFGLAPVRVLHAVRSRCPMATQSEWRSPVFYRERQEYGHWSRYSTR